MTVIERLRRVYSRGGLTEVLRKVFFKTMYSIKNAITVLFVRKHEMEYALNQVERQEKVIVSMTTYKERFAGICDCIKSLCLQKVKPDKICIYFGSDVTPDDLTSEMLEFMQYGVEYFFDDTENLKSHKKYYYAFQAFPDDVIITVDDDVYYPPDWLQKMMKTHRKFPDAVCAWRLHKMTFTDTDLKDYRFWIDEYRKEKEPSFSLLPTGVGGVLYPPRIFDNDVLDKELFKTLCFNADDIWLKISYTKRGVKTVWVPNWEVSFAGTEKVQKSSLSDSNVANNQNDVILKNVMDKMGLDYRMFLDR